MSQSMIQHKFTILRLTRKGKSTPFLKLKGWVCQPGDLNNRYGATAVVPGRDFAEIVREVRRLGGEGIAFQITDLQWKHQAAETDAQWQARVDLTLDDARFDAAIAKA